MNKVIDKIKSVRLFLLNQVNDLTVEQLNEIPTGFNNNIIWNIAHLTAAQQGLCYLRCGLKPVIEEKYLLSYKSGTKPEIVADSTEIEIIKGLLLSSVDKLGLDYADNLFASYPVGATRYGELKDIDDAISFVLFHEGLHSGYINAMKRILTK